MHPEIIKHKPMKSKELMIGDLVLYKGSVAKITTGRLSSLAYVEEFPESEEAKLLGKYDPIPLTEEILEANGFHQLDEVDYEYVYSRDDVTFCVCKRDLTCPYIRFGGYFFCNTNYVHELQRVLRCCGFFDLADNFKAL